MDESQGDYLRRKFLERMTYRDFVRKMLDDPEKLPRFTEGNTLKINKIPEDNTDEIPVFLDYKECFSNIVNNNDGPYFVHVTMDNTLLEPQPSPEAYFDKLWCSEIGIKI